MPSKRGGRERAASVPLAEALASAIQASSAPASTPSPPAAVDLSNENQALRRGEEVDRFNDLVFRQDSLTPEESDELYRFRVRRLLTTGRALERSAYVSEEELRQNLDRYRRRLEALRAFESLRAEQGRPVEPFAIDASAEERAQARLLQLARAREHGLIGGATENVPAAPGTVRVPTLPFAPTADDVPLYVLASPTQPSDALGRSIDVVAASGARVRLVHDPAEIPRDDPMPMVLNWGYREPLLRDVVALNRPEAVRIAADQVESLRRLRELAPRTVLHPDDLMLLRSERAVAKRRRGSQGRGKAVIACDGEPEGRAAFDLYQEFIPNRREWRVSVLSGRIVSAYLKEPPVDAASVDLRPDWIHRRTDVLPRAVARVAREAASRVGLDYSGIDMIQDLDTGRVLCLEANAAPGMSEDTIRALYGQIQLTLRGRQRRAS
jgi:hypothetical protein